MKRILGSLVLVGALLTMPLVGCKSGDSGKPADTAAKTGPCTKCKCTAWTDANGDGKCDTMVDGKACDHALSDHPAPHK
jgi:hypothetical protein